MSNSTEDFFKGLILGAAVGTVAGILLHLNQVKKQEKILNNSL